MTHEVTFPTGLGILTRLSGDNGGPDAGKQEVARAQQIAQPTSIALLPRRDPH
jgi:hypothetical protein